MFFQGAACFIVSGCGNPVAQRHYGSEQRQEKFGIYIESSSAFVILSEAKNLKPRMPEKFRFFTSLRSVQNDKLIPKILIPEPRIYHIIIDRAEGICKPDRD